jgi:hypothetical protein
LSDFSPVRYPVFHFPFEIYHRLPMGRHEPLDYWLALTLAPGIGVLGIARAFQGLGSVEAVFKVPVSTLVSFGVRKKAAEAVATFSDWSRSL